MGKIETLNWQTEASDIVATGEEMLWSSRGEQTLNHLLDCGLKTSTIRQARLGYLPGEYRDWYTLGDLVIPCGILIPWLANGTLQALTVQRTWDNLPFIHLAPDHDPGLYNGAALSRHHLALICTSELDALLVQQEAPDLVAPVVPAGLRDRLTSQSLRELAPYHLFVVAADRHTPTWTLRQLRNLSPSLQTLTLPHGKHITDFHRQGGDVYAWLAAAIQKIGDTSQGKSHAP